MEKLVEKRKFWNLAYSGQEKVGLYEKNIKLNLLDLQQSRLARGDYEIQTIYQADGKFYIQNIWYEIK